MDISCILNRRSIREYAEGDISAEQIKTLLTAGMYAPSAMNSQPWEFIVVKNRDTLDKLAGGAPYWSMLRSAPLAIVVLADISGYKATTTEFFKQDCSAATQNILCAAEGLGLGGVWLGLYGKEDRMSYVAEALDIPDGIHPFSLLSIGIPKNHPQPHDFFHENKVHYDKY